MSVSRLLIVITRMYAEKCEDGDEFTEVWGIPEDCGKSHMVFPSEQAAEERVVLVIHGYDYPDYFDDEAYGRAAESIKLALSKIGAGGREIGVAFHPPQSWEESEVTALARALHTGMIGDQHAVKFVTEYRNGSPLQRSLADLCRNGQDLAEEFDRIWSDLIADDSNDRQMGGIRHKIINKLGPIQKDLEGWREDGSGREAGRKLFEIYGGKARNTLNSVRDLVEQTTQHANTVANVVAAVKLKRHGEQHPTVIETTFQRLKALFQGDTVYAEASEVFALFDDRPRAGQDDAEVEKLQKLLADKNPVKEWYDAVLAAFDELRKAIGV